MKAFSILMGLSAGKSDRKFTLLSIETIHKWNDNGSRSLLDLDNPIIAYS